MKKIHIDIYSKSFQAIIIKMKSKIKSEMILKRGGYTNG